MPTAPAGASAGFGGDEAPAIWYTRPLMTTIDPDILEQFAAACRKAGAQGLMRCSSGNMSRRIDEERMLVSASGSWMAELTAEQVTVVRIADGAVLSGPRPSVETVFHAGILRARRESSVVLHFQTPCATTLACGAPADVNYFVIPEIPFYIGPIGIVGYHPPGSAALAEAVTDVMTWNNLAMMTSHGQVTLGATYAEAMQRAVFFEMACEIIVRGGDGVRPLSDEAAAGQMKAARGKGYGTA